MSGRSDAGLIAWRARARYVFVTALLASSSTCCACAGEDTIRLLEKPDSGTVTSGCRSDADCSADHPRCDPDEHRCVECLSATECSQGLICSSMTHTCESHCASSADCAGLDQTVCNADGACVQCATDNDCAGTTTPRCNVQSGGVCVQCLVPTDCSPGTCFDDCRTCVSNTCVWRT